MPQSSGWHIPVTGIFTWENALTNILSIWDIFQPSSCSILFPPHSQHCTVEKKRHLTSVTIPRMPDFESWGHFFLCPFCLILHWTMEINFTMFSFLSLYTSVLENSKVSKDWSYFLTTRSYRFHSLITRHFSCYWQITQSKEVIALLPLNQAPNKYDNLGVGGRNMFIRKYMAVTSSKVKQQ